MRLHGVAFGFVAAMVLFGAVAHRQVQAADLSFLVKFNPQIEQLTMVACGPTTCDYSEITQYTFPSVPQALLDELDRYRDQSAGSGGFSLTFPDGRTGFFDAHEMQLCVYEKEDPWPVNLIRKFL